MRIGPEPWRWVSTDSAGVPRGGRFGDVAWFERKAARHGLHLAWSRLQGCFALYTRKGPSKLVCQRLLHRDDDWSPLPLTSELLSLIVSIWESNARVNWRTIDESLRMIRADELYQAESERRKRFDDMEKDVMRAAYLKRGLETPNLMILPKGPVAIRGRN